MHRNLIALPAAAVLAALALAGCGGEPTEDSTSESPEPAETTESPSPAPEPSPTEEPVPTDDTPLEATDGTDLDACFDGTCEVAVETGDGIEFDAKFDVGTVEVVDVADSTVSLVLMDGMSNTTFGIGGGGAAGGGDGTEVIGYTLMSISGDTAIISFYPQERDDS